MTTPERLTETRVKTALDATNAVLNHIGKLNGDSTIKFRQKYFSAAERLPADIRKLGLGPAVALHLSAQEDAENWLLSALANWLMRQCPYLMEGTGNVDGAQLLSHVTSVGQSVYILLRREAELYACELKRLSQAFVRE